MTHDGKIVILLSTRLLVPEGRVSKRICGEHPAMAVLRAKLLYWN